MNDGCTVLTSQALQDKKIKSFKVGLSPSRKVGFISLNESPLKMMDNAFYFILKSLFVLKTYVFVLTFLVMGLVSPQHSSLDFSRKIFLMLHSINWPHFVVRLSLLVEISGSMCIVIICYPVCDVMSLEIFLSYLNKTFFCMTKKSEQKFKYRKKDKSF